MLLPELTQLTSGAVIDLEMCSQKWIALVAHGFILYLFFAFWPCKALQEVKEGGRDLEELGEGGFLPELG